MNPRDLLVDFVVRHTGDNDARGRLLAAIEVLATPASGLDGFDPPLDEPAPTRRKPLTEAERRAVARACTNSPCYWPLCLEGSTCNLAAKSRRR